MDFKEINRVGGPAFPQPCTKDGYAANSPYSMAGGGMSLRDYFAGQALVGLLSNSTLCQNIQDSLITRGIDIIKGMSACITHQAYTIADDMVKFTNQDKI